jgi:hypothetical protein
MSLIPLRSKPPSNAFGEISCCDSLPLVDYPIVGIKLLEVTWLTMTHTETTTYDGSNSDARNSVLGRLSVPYLSPCLLMSTQPVSCCRGT